MQRIIHMTHTIASCLAALVTLSWLHGDQCWRYAIAQPGGFLTPRAGCTIHAAWVVHPAAFPNRVSAGLTFPAMHACGHSAVHKHACLRMVETTNNYIQFMQTSQVPLVLAGAQAGPQHPFTPNAAT